jgi:hypothetical protein
MVPSVSTQRMVQAMAVFIFLANVPAYLSEFAQMQIGNPMHIW